MSFIEVYFNSSLQETIELINDPISIGRAGHNQICIDNKGISLMHAVVTKITDVWYIEDLNSTNGTFLNGVKVEGRQAIKLGDTITICKHVLRVVDSRSKQTQARAVKQDDFGDRTIMVSAPRAEQTESPSVVNHSCHLLVSGEVRGINKLLLNKDSYRIGKARENDLRIGGWFTAKLIAEIMRIGDHYYLSPVKMKSVKLNGRVVNSRCKLSNDDIIIIKKLTMKFIVE
jgi:pSer/pThr/pTyr-binding forkhead associated (FHA) protein